MVLGIILFFVAILSLFAVFRELKNRNVLAILFAGASTAVFGWFSVMTIMHALFPDSF
ncbi:DUF2759 domain-containing protein [Tenuibacillus multivorans]|uniref:DUF2759 domain-containing protein n=1 Tax=Tenuibacillus multivorans TaxID=237069 RepID=A0A1G9Z9Z1_9BACI|nr:DUF2759 domain-containing protein [Tenuibacillus multivorans]GEL77336.1 hypothetical protein TMU01_15710 [Tenuibacillus multivorans]SDN18154.1 Protein of unknown function [Tenuibacillus multivorans]